MPAVLWLPIAARGRCRVQRKFTSGQMLWRSGSCLSLAAHIRFTYRVFLYPRDSWQCSSIRLAADTYIYYFMRQD
ncbi:MAG: hypothetical protein ACI80M_000728 [Gammaproteobacteria bacterium]|jgi:formylglycine-generating enzyme required for sulfatase activity